MGIRFVFERDKEEEKVTKIKIPIELKSRFKRPVKEQEGFVLDWERALGYRENPFKREILEPVSRYIANLENEKEKLNLFVITDKKFGTIIGPEGSGKSSLMKWLGEQLEKFKYKIAAAYIDGSEAKTNIKLVKGLFKPLSGFKFSEDELASINTDNFDSKLKEALGEKKYVILIDNLSSISKEKFIVLDKILSMNTQVVFAGTSSLSSSLDSLKEWLEDKDIRLIDELKIKVEGIPLKGAKWMLKKRIEKVGGKGIYPFDEDMVKRIWLRAKRNPSRILELCNDYAIEMSVKKREGVKIEDIRSYQKDGVKLEKPEDVDDDFLMESKDEKKERGKDYKIQVIKRNEGVVIKEQKGKRKAKKK